MHSEPCSEDAAPTIWNAEYVAAISHIMADEIRRQLAALEEPYVPRRVSWRERLRYRVGGWLRGIAERVDGRCYEEY